MISKNIIFLLLVVVLFPLCVLADDSCKIYRITDDSLNHRFPKLDGDKIVWRGYTSSGKAAVFYECLTTEERINLTEDIYGFIGIPSISEGQVAWRVWDQVDRFYIYFWDGNEKRIVADYPAGDFTMPWGYPPSYHSVDVSLEDGQIVWAGWDGDDYEIFLWDGEIVHQITDNSIPDYEPQLSKGQVSWTGEIGEKPDVFFWDGESIRNISNRPDMPDEDSHLMNGIIAWSGWNHNEYRRDIYVWDGESTTVINLPGDDYEPQIDSSETFVTWTNRKNDQYDIYVWDRYGVIPFVASPDYNEISSFANRGKIVFSRYNENGYDVYLAKYKNESDFDSDGDVNRSDLEVFEKHFGRTDCNGDCEGDFDGDGNVDGSDLAVFASDFGSTSCQAWEY